MKAQIPVPYAIGTVIAVLAVIGFFMVRSLTVEPRTPRPDPALFGGRTGASGPPSTSLPTTR